MKISQSVKTAKRSGQIVLFLLLNCPWLGFAQTPIPPFAAPPVRITSPANHATFYAPVDIPIFAYACLPSIGYLIPTANSVSNVEFFANAIDLGSGVNLSATNRPILLYKATPSLSLLSSLYCFVFRAGSRRYARNQLLHHVSAHSAAEIENVPCPTRQTARAEN